MSTFFVPACRTILSDTRRHTVEDARSMRGGRSFQERSSRRVRLPTSPFSRGRPVIDVAKQRTSSGLSMRTVVESQIAGKLRCDHVDGTHETRDHERVSEHEGAQSFAMDLDEMTE